MYVENGDGDSLRSQPPDIPTISGEFPTQIEA
jgi:hypothetical protein